MSYSNDNGANVTDVTTSASELMSSDTLAVVALLALLICWLLHAIFRAIFPPAPKEDDELQPSHPQRPPPRRSQPEPNGCMAPVQTAEFIAATLLVLISCIISSYNKETESSYTKNDCLYWAICCNVPLLLYRLTSYRDPSLPLCGSSFKEDLLYTIFLLTPWAAWVVWDMADGKAGQYEIRPPPEFCSEFYYAYGIVSAWSTMWIVYFENPKRRVNEDKWLLTHMHCGWISHGSYILQDLLMAAMSLLPGANLHNTVLKIFRGDKFGFLVAKRLFLKMLLNCIILECELVSTLRHMLVYMSPYAYPDYDDDDEKETAVATSPPKGKDKRTQHSDAIFYSGRNIATFVSATLAAHAAWIYCHQPDSYVDKVMVGLYMCPAVIALMFCFPAVERTRIRDPCQIPWETRSALGTRLRSAWISTFVRGLHQHSNLLALHEMEMIEVELFVPIITGDNTSTLRSAFHLCRWINANSSGFNILPRLVQTLRYCIEGVLWVTVWIMIMTSFDSIAHESVLKETTGDPTPTTVFKTFAKNVACITAFICYQATPQDACHNYIPTVQALSDKNVSVEELTELSEKNLQTIWQHRGLGTEWKLTVWVATCLIILLCALVNYLFMRRGKWIKIFYTLLPMVVIHVLCYAPYRQLSTGVLISNMLQSTVSTYFTIPAGDQRKLVNETIDSMLSAQNSQHAVGKSMRDWMKNHTTCLLVMQCDNTLSGVARGQIVTMSHAVESLIGKDVHSQISTNCGTGGWNSSTLNISHSECNNLSPATYNLAGAEDTKNALHRELVTVIELLRNHLHNGRSEENLARATHDLNVLSWLSSRFQAGGQGPADVQSPGLIRSFQESVLHVYNVFLGIRSE